MLAVRNTTDLTQPIKDIRRCILDQGDIHNQKMVEREALVAANFDNGGAVPEQVWYDQLRETDDGRFCHKGALAQKKRDRNVKSQLKIDVLS